MALLDEQPTPDELAHRLGDWLPPRALRRLVGAGLAGLACALCLHRVGAARPTDWQPGLTLPADELDALLELLLAARPGRSAGWLSVTFDDGYADAAEYVRTRAPRFPGAEFLFFVCPEKVAQRAGFRWDLCEEAQKAGVPRAEALALCDAPVDVRAENARADLQALSALPDYRLATVDEVRALEGLPNVLLGNHTNVHLSAVAHADAVVADDYRRSANTFRRLFGPHRHFAFPYGTPGHHVAPRHVALARGLGDLTLWTTEARPSRPGERRPGGVLPRFAVDGRRSARQLAAWVAARGLDFQLRGRAWGLKPAGRLRAGWTRG